MSNFRAFLYKDRTFSILGIINRLISWSGICLIAMTDTNTHEVIRLYFGKKWW